jgi:DNA-binding transcriptional regulator YiaG
MSEEELPEQAVQQLVSWRQRNGLSQRAAVEAMQRRNFPVTLTTLEKWESGERRPGRIVTQALLRFLQEYPTIPRE